MCLLAILFPAFPAFGQTPGAGAASSAYSVLNKLGTPGGVAQYVTTPMTSASTPMQNIAGTQSFSAQMSCPSTSQFAAVGFSTSTAAGITPTGDLTTVTVQQDTTFSGTFNLSYTIPFSVSGICANGVISCSPGTWTGCSYALWKADPLTYQIGLVPATNGIQDLGGCYCINGSCGSNLAMTNAPAVLKDLGGGVVGALQGVNPQFSVTDSKTTGTTITYYGQQAGNCTTGAVASGSPTPQQYYNNSTAIPTAAATAVTTQSSSTTSYYSLLNNGTANQGQGGTLQNCSVIRTDSITPLTVFSVISPVGGSGSVTSCGPNCIAVTVTGGQWNPHSCSGAYPSFTVAVLKPALITSAIFTTGYYYDNAGFSINGAPTYNYPWIPWGCQGGSGKSNSVAPGINVTGYFTAGGNVTLSGWGVGAMEATVIISLSSMCQINPTSIADGCASLAANPLCSLQTETIDGVQTVSNFNPTGLAPLQSCQTITTGACANNFCEPWWNKSRSYLCKTAAAGNYSNLMKRVYTVESSSTNTNSTMTYKDSPYVNGVFQPTTTYTSSLPKIPPSGSCNPSCKVQLPRTNTQASTSGNASQFQTTTGTQTVAYRKCDSNNACPIGAGETLLSACACQNDFSEAASKMAGLDAAGHDLSCSGTAAAGGGCLGTLYIFNGTAYQCGSSALYNCCTNNPSIINPACSTAEVTLAQKQQKNLCTFMGGYCSNSIDPCQPLGSCTICLQNTDAYCCYNSMLAKIIQEQGRPQLQAFQPPIFVSPPQAPNCRGFTPDEFSMLDFSKIDMSAYYTSINPLASSTVQTNLNNNVNGYVNSLP